MSADTGKFEDVETRQTVVFEKLAAPEPEAEKPGLTVHIITIAYGLADDTERLFSTAVSKRHNVTWHLFVHSRREDVQEVVKKLARRKDVILYDYGDNRGVAKSWNEGLIAAYDEAGADMAIIANDDVSLGQGDLDRFIDGAWEAIQGERLLGHVTCTGYDMADRKDTRVLEAVRNGLSDEQYSEDMRFGFVVITRTGWDVIGCFDEQFIPMYFEDVDWVRRAKLAGLKEFQVQGTRLIHRGSANRRSIPELDAQNHQTFPRNHAYYKRKWADSPNHERFIVPFNDRRFGLRIAASDRSRPYWGYERDAADYELVKI